MNPAMNPSPGTSEPFGSEPQDAFLARIRSRLRSSNRSGVSTPAPYPPGGGDDRGGAGGPNLKAARVDDAAGYEERVALFARSLEAVGGKVSRAADPEAAFALIADDFKRRGVRRAVVGEGEWTALRALLATDIALDEWSELSFAFGERSLQAVDGWDAGISWVDYAVAELGSVVVVASRQQGRSVSLLPPYYVALVPGERLAAKRKEVLQHVADLARRTGRMPSFTFITGPSRSADIEMDLSIGVHGPGEVWAIVVDQADQRSIEAHERHAPR